MALRAQPLKMGMHQINGVQDATKTFDAINLGQLNASITAQLNLQGVRYPTEPDFGAVGDGVTLDDAAVLAWLQYCRDNGYIADGQSYLGKVFLLTDPLVLSNVIDPLYIRNFTWKDDGTIADFARLFHIKGGGPGSSIAINALARGDTSITLNASGTVTDGDVVYVQSSDKWCDVAISGDPTVTMGEWVIATSTASGAGNSFTIDRHLRYDYTTSPTVKVTAMAEHVTLENCKGISDDPASGHYSVDVQYAKHVVMREVSGLNCGFAGASVTDVMHFFSENCGNVNGWAGAFGLNYGVLVSETVASAILIHPYYRGGRHAAASGGTAGQIGYYCVLGAWGCDAHEAFIDAHASIDVFHIIGGNADVDDTEARGVSSKARVLIINGLSVRGPYYGVVASTPNVKYPSKIILKGCDIETSDIAVYILQTGTQTTTIECDGDFKSTNTQGLFITCNILSGTPGHIETINLKGRYKGDDEGAYIYAQDGVVIDTVIADGEFIATAASGKYALYLRATAVGDIDVAKISGILRGGQYGLAMNKPNIVMADCIAVDYTASPVFNDESAGTNFLDRFKINMLTRGTQITDARVARPASSVTPLNNGDVVTQLTSNTSLTFKAKGSDGTVRSGSVTLS